MFLTAAVLVLLVEAGAVPTGAEVPEGHTPPLASQASPGRQDAGEERSAPRLG